VSSLFGKINNNNRSPFATGNNNTNNTFQGSQSNGFDSTDRALGYSPQMVTVNPPNTFTQPPQQTQPQHAPTPGFSFGAPQQQGYQPPLPQQPQLPQGYEQEFYTFHYPSKGEIAMDLGIRVFEVVIGAAAIAAGQEIAKFFSRRRIQPAIPQVYEQYYKHPPNAPQNYGQQGNNQYGNRPVNNPWRK